MMEDKEYIKNLEQLVILLCDIYDETAMIAEKELVENNNDLYRKLPLIQGVRNQLAINNIAALKESLKDSRGYIRYEFNLDSTLNKMKAKY